VDALAHAQEEGAGESTIKGLKRQDSSLSRGAEQLSSHTRVNAGVEVGLLVFAAAFGALANADLRSVSSATSLFGLRSRCRLPCTARRPVDCSLPFSSLSFRRAEFRRAEQGLLSSVRSNYELSSLLFLLLFPLPDFWRDIASKQTPPRVRASSARADLANINRTFGESSLSFGKLQAHALLLRQDEARARRALAREIMPLR
jgi:hypothetical protein